MGIHQAGHEVVGVDLHPQPNYPFKFIQANAVEVDLDGWDAYWASPPCQQYSWSCSHMRIRGKQYPDLIYPIRERLIRTGKPFVIENVAGAPVRKDLMLCGKMFDGLKVYRHRYFEIHNFKTKQPRHPKHEGRIGPIRSKNTNGYYTVAGHMAGTLKEWREAMNIDWMNREEIVEAIPPDYSHYIFSFLEGK